MTAIRKVVITEFGDVDVVKVVDGTCSPPKAGEIQIATEFSGFNGADINMRKGIYPFQKKAPLTPGYCLVGPVRELGAGCKALNKGDTVAVLTKYDAEATLVNQPEKYCVKVPDGVDHQQATAIMLDWSTAYAMVMHKAKVKQGQRVFIHGLSGAVGCGIMNICKLQGAEVYGTASQRNHESLEQNGAHPFVYSDKKWMDSMKALGGADAVFDPLGFESFDESFAILSPTGIVVGYGNNKNTLGDGAGKPPRSPLWPMLKLLLRNLNVFSSKRTTFYGQMRSSSNYLPDVKALMDLLHKKTVQIPIKKVWDLEDIQKAHREWGTGEGMGSLLIRVAKKEEQPA